jgi:ATP-dependent Clp protease ATP-binding subunit ClpA
MEIIYIVNSKGDNLMSKNDYQVFRVKIKKANDFEILVLQLPEIEVEDKLAYLTKEKGQISKGLYEDYVIATCVANINQLLFQLAGEKLEVDDLLVVRLEVMAAIIAHNPKLDPDNLVINKNHVIKLKTDNVSDDIKALTDTKFWSQKAERDSFKDIPPAISDVATVDTNKNNTDLNKLTYTVVQKWWKRIGQYIQIKRFSPEDTEAILKNRYFHNRTSFATFVVSFCVDGFEGLFTLLDDLGIPKRVAPPLLMHELYELCRSCNEFLTYENAHALSDEPDEEDDSCGGSCGSKKKSATSGTMGQYAGGNKKKKKSFRDLPKEDLLKLADNMKIMLVGQDDAVDKLSEAIQRASVGLKAPNKPIGSFLFAGRTGVGKTQATKVLADELIKGRDNLINIDCSEYSADHEYAKLIGSPSGYVGHEAGGFLTNAVMKNPFSVIVFDEVEKASRKVHELLLQILEEGRLTDGKGKTVDFNQTIIVMTSNVGVDEVERIRKTIGFGSVAEITENKKEAALDKALKNKFKPEFLNRIDSIIHFKSLNKKDFMRIIDIELYKLNDNLRANDTDYKELWLEFDEKIKEFVYEKGIDSDYGARPLKRAIEREVATPLAKKLLAEDDVQKDITIKVSAKKGKVSFTAAEKEEVSQVATCGDGCSCAEPCSDGR